MSINTSLAGIQAALARLDVAAMNIANLRSQGYHAYRAHQAEGAPDSGPRVQVERTDDPPELTTEAIDMLAARHDLTANLIAFRRQQEALGSIIDILA